MQNLQSTLKQLYFSSEYREFKEQQSELNARFSTLKEHQKLQLYYLHISKKLDQVEDLIWETKPVSPQEFLDNPDYLGKAGKSLYKVWREEFIKFFDKNHSVNELILSGAIRTGKSYLARYILAYIVYKIQCLRNPQETFGLSVESIISAMFLAINQKKANAIGLKPFGRLLRVGNIFREVRSQEKLLVFNEKGKIPFFISSEWQIYFPKNVEIKVACSEEDLVGENAFAIIADEVEKFPDVEAAMEIYGEAKSRVNTTFKRSEFTFLALISSAGLESGVVGTYLQKMDVNDNKFMRICRYAKWEVESNGDPFRNGYFYVIKGNLQTPSEIITNLLAENYLNNNLVQPPNTEIIKVPMSYYYDFKLSVNKALRDLAGRPTVTDDNLFGDLTRIEDENLTPLITIKCSIRDTVTKLINQIPANVFSTDFNGRRILARYPKAPRYAHIDYALNSGSECGITVVHKEKGEFGEVVVADFLIRVVTPDKFRIESMEDLIIDLGKSGVFFHTITFDGFQSASSIQRFIELGLARDIKLLSIDRTAVPALTLSALVSEDRFRCGKADILKKQLGSLTLDTRLNKLRKDGQQGVRDVAESCIGAAFNAVENKHDVPTNLYSKGIQVATSLSKIAERTIIDEKLQKFGFEVE